MRQLFNLDWLARILISGLLLGSYVALPARADPPGGLPPQGLLGQEQRRLEENQEFVRRHSDATGTSRPDLWIQGIEHTKQMDIDAGIVISRGTGKLSIRGGLAQPTATPSAVTGVQWTQIGPAPLRIDAEQIFQGAGPDSGQVTDIAIDPRNTSDQVIYIASNDGGVWKSTDGGAHWAPMTDYLTSLSMGALALDPGNPSIVYAGTGNLFNNGFFKGVGIYRSIDGGESWSTVGAGVLSGKGVNRIVMPASNVLLVATNQGLYKSVDGGLNFGSNSPSFNNGAAVLGGYITDLKLDTASSTTVYAAVNGTGILRSTDSGSTFPTTLFNSSNLTGGTTAVGFISLAQSTKPDNKTLYANVATPTECTKDSSGNPTAGAICAQVYKSTDTGGTWTNTGTSAQNAAKQDKGCQCGYDQTIGVDPQDANRVYIGYQELYASTDGGANFGIPAISQNKIHWDHHALTFSPSTHWGGSGAPTAIWIGTDGGVHRSTDGGSNWSNLNEGIATNLFRQIDIGRGNATNNAYTYGGTQDTGIIERRPGFAGLDWHLGIDGDGGNTAVDPCNASHAISSDDGGFEQTTNGGTNWGGASGFPAKSTVGVVAFDPTCSNTVYIAVYTPVTGPPASTTIQLFVSTDNGSNFTALKTFTQALTAIGTTAQDQNTLWLGLNNGTLQRTADAKAATPTWTAVTVPGAPGGQPVSGVAIDPSNPQVVVVVYPGFTNINPANRTRHVFMTTDNGANWTDVSGTDGGDPAQNLPDIPLNSVVIDAGTNPHSIIVSSDAAVMRSADNGATWQVFGVGLPTVQGTSLQIDSSATPSLLRVGTYGRSVFELTAATGPLLAVNGDLGFGTVPLGQFEDRVVQLFNVGSTDLHVSSFTRISGSPDFKIVSGPATPVTILPGEEVDYTIRFQPSSSGDKTAVFQVNSDDPFKPAYQLFASGTGGGPILAVNADLAFGTIAVGTNASRVVQVFNVGTSDLHVSSFSRLLGGSTDFSVISGPSTPVTVAPAGEVDFTVRFAPTASGAEAATFRLVSDDPTTPNRDLAATGTGGVGVLKLSSSSLNFGSVAVDDRTSPNSSTQVLTITNQASCTFCDMTVNSLTVSGANMADFTVVAPATLPATVAATNSLPVSVVFNPSGAGVRNATLTVNVTLADGSNPIVDVPLSGTGLIPAIATAPNPLIFPPTVVSPVCGTACGTSLAENITNTGAAELILDALTVTAGASSFSAVPPTSPPTRVAVGGGKFAETVTFQPSGAPSRKVAGTLHVQDDVVSSSPSAPVAADVALCGEAVGRGIRVLAMDTTGNVFTSLKSLSLKSSGTNPVINVNINKNLVLTTINPPTSCQVIQYQYENQNLPATDTANKKSQYTLTVSSSGGHTSTVTFTLGVAEFKTIVVTIQP